MGGTLGGRARLEPPGKAMLSLGCEGHEGISQGFGLLGHRRDLACTVRRFLRVETLLDIRAAVLHQAIDETRQFVCRGRDGLWGADYMCGGAAAEAPQADCAPAVPSLHTGAHPPPG
jgi:hypothetical protein